ncbi:MAG: zinc ribbon domain-containing protein [Anaerovorax sp.]|nr:zinc ribbon domain-containing protein [Anaerovorax sp.]
MYCKMCGTEINSTDLFCKVCGTKIEEAESQTTSSDSLESKHEEFTWNIYEFPQPRKTEDINFKWNLNSLEEKETKKEEVLNVENPNQSSENGKAQNQIEEEEKIIWEIPKKASFKEEIKVSSFEDLPDAMFHTEVPTQDYNTISEDKIPAGEVSDMDKFFTFSKKNEEFQQLLDREYEKIQKKNMERPSLKESQITNVMNDLDSSKQAVTQSLEIKKEERDEVDTKPINLKDIKKACSNTSIIHSELEEKEPEELLDSEMEAKLAAHVNHLDEMMAARASFFVEEPEDIAAKDELEEKKLVSNSNETVVGPNTEVLVTVEVKANGKSETVTRQTISMDPATISKAVEEKNEALTSALNKEDIIQENIAKEDIIQENSAEDMLEKEDEDKKENTSDLNNTLSQDDLTEFWQKNTFGMEEEKKINGPKVALGIIAAVLIIEIIALGIQFFFPQTAAAEAIYNVQSKIVKVFDSAAEGIGGIFKAEKNPTDNKETENGDSTVNQEKDALEEEPEAANPVPMSDKTALIESQISLNKNIQIISKADALVFDASHNYGIDDLNKSTSIDNNIWYTDENGKTVYYDQAVVGTLIAFNSQWIDYVNNGDKAILDLLKPNSKAYNKVSTFSKVGKISEIFESFSIGEIRKGSVGFYVFTEEKIIKKENGKESVISHDWIYYLEPIDKQMKIVNYL